MAPVAASRLPVGSSARRRRGRTAKARARATRCCSPPLSWPGRWVRRWAEADGAEAFGGAVGGVGAAGEFHGDADVLEGGHGGDEVEGLEDDADGAAAEAGEGVLGEAGDVLAGDGDGPGWWRLRGRRGP